MEIILIILLVIVIAGIIGLFLKQKSSPKEDGAGLQLLLQQINELSRVVDQKMGDSQKQIHESMKFQSTETARIVADITEKITRLDETNKQVVSFADQLQNLQDILKNPKQRGILGEYYLETLLKNVLPPNSYKMQYAFRNGEIVDAAVFIKDKIIPVDSKFSLENYNRIGETRDAGEKERLEKLFVNDLKLRIQETAKYIRPDEDTLDFAFMFIPHEAIYYDLLVGKVGLSDDENLIQRAAGKYKVIIVSPTSFLAYLQTVLQGLKALQIEESAKEIKSRVEILGKHLFAYDKYFKSVGKNLGTTVNQYNLAQSELQKIEKDVLKITNETVGIEPILIEKPVSDE